MYILNRNKTKSSLKSIRKVEITVGFVYDYTAPTIRGRHAENEPAKIYHFGPSQRAL